MTGLTTLVQTQLVALASLSPAKTPVRFPEGRSDSYREGNRAGSAWYLTEHALPAGKLMHLGIFSNVKDAALAYNTAALEHHGEFARLNNL